MPGMTEENEKQGALRNGRPHEAAGSPSPAGSAASRGTTPAASTKTSAAVSATAAHEEEKKDETCEAAAQEGPVNDQKDDKNQGCHEVFQGKTAVVFGRRTGESIQRGKTVFSHYFSHHAVIGILDAFAVIAFFESRNEAGVQQPASFGIIHGAFQTIADFDSGLSIFHGNKKKETVVFLFIPEAPVPEEAVGIGFQIAIRNMGDHDHHYLGMGLLIQGIA